MNEQEAFQIVKRFHPGAVSMSKREQAMAERIAELERERVALLEFVRAWDEFRKYAPDAPPAYMEEPWWAVIDKRRALEEMT